MKHLEIFESYIPNNLTYCTDCNQLKKTAIEHEKCIYCRVLNILGINYNTDGDILGQLKYRMEFLKSKSSVIKYIDELKTKYNLSNNQVDEIKEILEL
jgi:hypothetical protein